MDYEMNAVFAITNSAWVMYTLKTLGVLFLLWYMIKRYPVDYYPLYRYFMIYIIVLMFVMLIGVSANNYLYYLTPVADIGEPIPREEKIQASLKYIGDIGPLTDLGTEKKRIIISPLFSVFVLNMLQFIVWRGFEKKMIENKIVSMKMRR